MNALVLGLEHTAQWVGLVLLATCVLLVIYELVNYALNASAAHLYTVRAPGLKRDSRRVS
jgi:hypothetical protein